MANEPLNPTTPPVEPGEGTSIEKFKTGKDRDQAYLELEAKSRENDRRLAELEQQLERVSTAHQPDPYAGRSFTDLYPGTQPGQGVDPEHQLASRLLTRPTEVLKDVYQRAVNDTMAQVTTYMQQQDLVNRFKNENPDLARHEEIVAMYVRRQPQNLSSEERLRRAAPEARRYINDIAKAGGGQGASLDPASYVEAPSGQRTPVTAPVTKEPSDDDELSEAIRERNAFQQKRRL